MARRGLDAERVIATAGDVADADGLAAVTVARIAAELGVRGPSLYNHVPGREGLARGVALAATRELCAVLREAAVGRSGTDALVAMAFAYRGYALAHPGRYAALAAVATAAREDAELREASEDTLAVMLEVLRAWHLEGDDAVHAVRGLRSALHGFVDLERSGGFAMDVPLDASFERLVRGLAASLG
jgi:AcrR family transcriptional regulator